MRYVLYHGGGCPDGFGAAWVAHQKFGDQDTQYIPVSYGQEPPEMEPGSDVLIVDFSYPRDVLLRLADVHVLRVLDHHKTAQADLDGLDFCHFDMERSGARLAWDYLFPDKTYVPSLVCYVEDRDLWRWALVDSREISAWIGSYPFDFKQWSWMEDRLSNWPDQVANEGDAILRAKMQAIEAMCRHHTWAWIGTRRVPVANATVYFSEVGERLCELYPKAPFAAYYLDREDGVRQWGLRSRGGFDVSEVARAYGGGGHAGAAGFQERHAVIEIERAPAGEGDA